jgi:hypothetical protein
MSDTERRIALAFDFLGDVASDPGLLESIPDNAVVSLGHQLDHLFSEWGRELLRLSSETDDRPHVLLADWRSSQSVVALRAGYQVTIEKA